MMNPLAAPHFYTFNQYLKDTYPYKVYKIPIDAGFTCPNRDGVKAVGGCTYCDNESFSPGTRGGRLPVETQIANGIKFYQEKRKAKKFIVYFQAYSNTYGDVDYLKSVYDRAFAFPDVIGISIGTRPDCIDEEKLDMIREYKDRGHYVLMEYGLESLNPKVLEQINRQNTVEDFFNAIEMTQKKGLDICAHTILGLPGDSYNNMMDMARTLAALKLTACKIHHLYIAPHTVMEEQYHQGKIKVITLNDYVSLACDFLERLPSTMIIHRFIGELYGDHCIAPKWGVTKAQVIEHFTKEFEKRGTQQGSQFDPKFKPSLP